MRATDRRARATDSRAVGRKNSFSAYLIFFILLFIISCSPVDDGILPGASEGEDDPDASDGGTGSGDGPGADIPGQDDKTPEDDAIAYETLVEGLEIPWEIRFLPGGDMLVTERPGRLLRLGEQKTRFEIEEVLHSGEGGLLGLALHPDFESNRWIYIYFTTREQGNGGITNRVERYVLENDSLTGRTLIIEGIPGASYHDGGRLEFGPDGFLYITTGDAGDAELAQDKGSLAGKILRLEDDGDIPESNPFGTEVYSYGHRNPQGLSWDDQGKLWSTEHGRSGIRSGFDELNLIRKGKNYGWPVIQGSETKEGMVSPELHSGPGYTWAPASAEHAEDNIFFGGLRGSALYEADISEETPVLEINLEDELGRIRAVRLHEGFLYITTSNRDGRGRATEGDDKIVRIAISSFI